MHPGRGGRGAVLCGDSLGWSSMRPRKQKIVKALRELGLTKDVAEGTYALFGAYAEQAVRKDPYCVLREVAGARWQQVDRIGLELDFAPDAPERLSGALTAGLIEAASEGHTWVANSALLAQTMERVQDRSATDEWFGTIRAIGGALDKLIESAWCTEEPLEESEDSGEDGSAIQLPALCNAESGIASCLEALLRERSKFSAKQLTPEERDGVARDLGLTLAGDQIRALEHSMCDKILIVTGGPGTGKTTLLRGVIRLWEQRGASIRLAAPTGRAAKRLSESTRRNARTIHRLLEYQPDSGRFGRDRDRRLSADLLIVDEASMIDTELMVALLRALPASSHLLLVGDVDQLPSVGPGAVLEDLIESGAVPTIRLTEIFRQSEGSLISLNARRINEGQDPVVDAGGIEMGQDFFFVEKASGEAVVDAILELVARRIPNQFGVSAHSDIQVIVPMHKGAVGVENLNTRLQRLLQGWDDTPGSEHLALTLEHEGRLFSVGDKVMQTKNDYARDIFNGDIGIIEDMDVEKQEVTVSIDGRSVRYERMHLYDLALAYAMTIHKSQGSEYPAVVVPLVMGHRRMLQRNLLYTAVSRGQRLVVIVGDRRAIQLAVRNDRVMRRRTRLRQRLAEIALP